MSTIQSIINTIFSIYEKISYLIGLFNRKKDMNKILDEMKKEKRIEEEKVEQMIEEKNIDKINADLGWKD